MIPAKHITGESGKDFIIRHVRERSDAAVAADIRRDSLCCAQRHRRFFQRIKLTVCVNVYESGDKGESAGVDMISGPHPLISDECDG